MNLLTRKLIGVATRPFLNNSPHCERCKRSWKLCRPHILQFRSLDGALIDEWAICEDCNTDLVPADKLPFYQRMVSDRVNRHTVAGAYEAAADVMETIWPAIKTAVMEGK